MEAATLSIKFSADLAEKLVSPLRFWNVVVDDAAAAAMATCGLLRRSMTRCGFA